MKDIFLCHASEDKVEVVRPLFQAMTDAHISCWLDEAEIHWGDSITQKVDEGLRKSRYVIVVLSQVFLDKKWPQRELNSSLNIEASTGEVRVLPLVVGNEATKEAIMNQFALINDKLYLSWNGSTGPIIEALLKRLGKMPAIQQSEKGLTAGNTYQSDFPLPKIKKRFTQYDKDIFLKESFQIVKSYFQHALSDTENCYPGIKTDFTEIHNFKFIAKIYVNGAVKAQCKIWIGGISNSNSITYSLGDTNFSHDNSCNGMLSIEDSADELCFNLDFGGFNLPDSETKSLIPTKAAQLLWREFISNLER